jgi:hypothetical protein
MPSIQRFCSICGRSQCEHTNSRSSISSRSGVGTSTRVPNATVDDIRYINDNIIVNGRRIGSVASWRPTQEESRTFNELMSDSLAALAPIFPSSYQNHTMGHFFGALGLQPIISRADLKAFLKSNGFKRCYIDDSARIGIVFLQIRHFWFRLSKFEADLQSRIPVGVRYVCTKWPFREWVARLLRQLTIGYRLAHRKRRIQYTKFDFVLGSKR